MAGSSVVLDRPAIPVDVLEFAAGKGLTEYLAGMVDLARQAFPFSVLCVSLGQDAEDESHRYIALDVDVASRPVDELLAGQRLWSAGASRVCPSKQAVYFVLGWR